MFVCRITYVFKHVIKSSWKTFLNDIFERICKIMLVCIQDKIMSVFLHRRKLILIPKLIFQNILIPIWGILDISAQGDAGPRSLVCAR